MRSFYAETFSRLKDIVVVYTEGRKVYQISRLGGRRNISEVFTLFHESRYVVVNILFNSYIFVLIDFICKLIVLMLLRSDPFGSAISLSQRFKKLFIIFVTHYLFSANGPGTRYLIIY